MLQAEVQETRIKIEQQETSRQKMRQKIETFSELLSTQTSIAPLDAVKVKRIGKRYENVAGVEVPYFEDIEFEEFSYSLFETAPWLDAAIVYLRNLAVLREQIHILHEQKTALEKELREVSIRVNLFEKILIPRAISNIRKIKVFLGDQELAAVSRAKVAKAKIEAGKEKKLVNMRAERL